MAVLRMQESKFGAPKGIYQGKFLGINPMKDSGRLGKDGKPMAPGIEWQFEIVEGDYAGKIVGRITAATPTKANSCGKLLQGLVGKQLSANDETDVNDYVGQTYQVVVGAGVENPDKTQVTEIFRQGGKAAPSSSAGTPPAPPRKPGSSGSAEFWVVQMEGVDPVKMDKKFLQKWLNENSKDSREIDVCPVGTQDWKKAADYGLTSGLPF